MTLCSHPGCPNAGTVLLEIPNTPEKVGESPHRMMFCDFHGENPDWSVATTRSGDG